DSLLASHALTNLFRQRECIFSARVLTFSDDEVRMHWRNYCAAATLSLHSHLVDHLARADRACRRVLEKTTCRTRAVRLRRESTTLRIVHTRFDLLRIVRRETQRRAEQQFAFAKRSVTIVPFDTLARN